MSPFAPESSKGEMPPSRVEDKGTMFSETTMTQAARAPELSLALDGSGEAPCCPPGDKTQTAQAPRPSGGSNAELAEGSEVAEAVGGVLAGSQAARDSQAEDDTQALLPELLLSAETQPEGPELNEKNEGPTRDTPAQVESQDVLEARPKDAQRPNLFAAGDISDDSDDDLDLSLGLRPTEGDASKPKKALSRLRRKVSSEPEAPPGSPTLLSQEAGPPSRAGRALQVLHSDSEEEPEEAAVEPQGRSGAALASDGEREDTEEGPALSGAEEQDEDDDKQEEEAVLSSDELNMRTQNTMIEHGKRSRVGGIFKPEAKSLSHVLEKLKQCHDQAAKRAPVIALEMTLKPAKMEITDIAALMLSSSAAMADDSDDELILEDDATEFDQADPTDATHEGEESEGEELEHTGEEARPVPVLAGVLKGSKRLRGVIASQRHMTAAQLEGLDLATSDRVPEPLEVEGEEEEEVIIQDYEAMEEGSDFEAVFSGDEEEDTDKVEPASDSEDEMEDEGEEQEVVGSDDDEVVGEEQEEEEEAEDSTQPSKTARRTVRLAEMSDDEDDDPPAAHEAGASPVTKKQAKAFVEMEAEMSDDEGHDGEEDDDDDAEDGVLKGLIGTAKDGAKDEAIRAKMHAQWEAERDRKELQQAVLARRHGYKRGIDVSDDEDENRAARRRRAAAVADSDDEGPRPTLAGVMDLQQEEPDDEGPTSPLSKEILEQDMLRSLNRHCDLDTALGQGLDESSQGMMRLLQGRSDSRLCSSSDGNASNKAGLLRLGSSRMGLFDISNHKETSNHATFLGRTSSVASRGGVGGKSTFTFAFNSQSQSQAAEDLEMPDTQTSSEFGQPQSSKAPTSFAGLLPKSGSGCMKGKGSSNRGKKVSSLVSILGNKGGKNTDADKRIDNMDLSSVLNARLGRA